MKVKIFQYLQLDNKVPLDLQVEMNEWFAKNPNIEIVFRDIHSESGTNVINQPYTRLTVMLYYRQN
jgi:hypothetical protein